MLEGRLSIVDLTIIFLIFCARTVFGGLRGKLSVGGLTNTNIRR